MKKSIFTSKQKWDGKLPHVTGGCVPFITIENEKDKNYGQ